jgi:uncharacterized protein YbjT (DUF2867 family)
VPVRSGTTSPGESSGIVTPVRLDWHDPATWGPAVDGAAAVYLMRPDLEDAPDLIARVVDLAPHATVVLLSEQCAGSLPDTSWERQVELAVTERATTWTVLRPSWFHQVLTDARYYLDAIRDDDVLPIPSGGTPIAFVDTRDIAAAAIAALIEGAAVREAITITGPDALAIDQVAALLSSATGRPIRALEPSRAEAAAGFDPWLAGIYEGVLDRVSQGVFAEVTDEVRRVTGREPRSMADFVSEHSAEWQR